MSKKEYKKPFIKVVELESASILAGSNPNPKYEEVDIVDDTPYTGPWG